MKKPKSFSKNSQNSKYLLIGDKVFSLVQWSGLFAMYFTDEKFETFL